MQRWIYSRIHFNSYLQKCKKRSRLFYQAKKTCVSQEAVLCWNGVGGRLLLQLLPHLDCCNQLIFSHELVNYCRHFLAVNCLSLRCLTPSSSHSLRISVWDFGQNKQNFLKFLKSSNCLTTSISKQSLVCSSGLLLYYVALSFQVYGNLYTVYVGGGVIMGWDSDRALQQWCG